jgi:hypothetical protein
MKPRITTAEIYRSRRIRAALDSFERDQVQTDRDRIGEALAETLSDTVRAKLETARDRLDEALGVADAPNAFAILARRLPRTLADVAHNYYAKEGTR